MTEPDVRRLDRYVLVATSTIEIRVDIGDDGVALNAPAVAGSFFIALSINSKTRLPISQPDLSPLSLPCPLRYPRILVNIHFIGDRSIGGPETEEEWHDAIKQMKDSLGLNIEHCLRDRMVDLFIHVNELNPEPARRNSAAAVES
ncbi:hypothetical protein PSTEL_04115 [Paenibacillus stellifer]|uniref:Uncharacterized protein n=1 Tax=Paenibacillus stellifer TaxID=169760 RepID=A0A089LLM5_9BACL|nr:hypothetical protein [Paenibacillus stellifer]AIQ62411.1 hypothetical protein PSTEL_04115 [Paenibacillus stellifer]